MPPPYLWDAFAICEVPEKANRTCCGLTRQGRPCKLSVTEEVHQMAIPLTFVFSMLGYRISFLISSAHASTVNFRSKISESDGQQPPSDNKSRPSPREERERSPEARLDMERTRYNPSMSPGQRDPAQLTTDVRLPKSSRLSTQRKIGILLREKGIPLGLSGDYMTEPSIGTEEGDEILLCMKDYRSASSLEDDKCGNCLGTEQNDSIVLKCGRCTFCVHLACMSTWLQSFSPGSKSSCLHV
ncbi:hypothetical protein N7494_005217 [Penicillium frequentans]|uniref:Uncharacterized protein n=1 Tax=Penicillium frequentans TaxID=3151616 RepID=A0AAD6CXR9_9EURO|nr:hypothetical protein N7494_005217 [Penicillium glabrum]